MNNDLLVTKLKSLLDVEKQLVKSLPKMSKKAADEDLQKGFEEHLEQTKGHVERLEDALKELEAPTKALKSEAIRGLIEDAEWMIKNAEDDSVLDASLVASARQIENYEIIGYSTAIEWALLLGHESIAEKLEQTLQEEEETDEKLEALAKSKINAQALVAETDA